MHDRDRDEWEIVNRVDDITEARACRDEFDECDNIDQVEILIPISHSKERKIIGEFAGVVTTVEDDKFWCELQDITVPENPNMECSISYEHIDKHELQYFQEGHLFKWLFYDNETDEFIFNKECWTEEELRVAKKLGGKMYRKLQHYAKVLPQAED